jgi:hypothetical protein
MKHFTNVKITDMVLAYGKAGGNVIQTQILYREQFLYRVVPNSKTFTFTVQRLKDTIQERKIVAQIDPSGWFNQKGYRYENLNVK